MVTNKLVLKNKIELTEGTFIFDFQMERTFNYEPGQYIVIKADEKVFRSYSIVEVDNTDPAAPMLKLLIDVKVGGKASVVFAALQVGESLNMIGHPVGKFVLKSSDRPKVFIATGTGLAPFIPMIKFLLAEGWPSEKIKLYFGSRHEQDAYAETFFPEQNPANPFIINCISQPKVALPSGWLEGRVTKILPEHLKSFTESDFYLCGNPRMVEDVNAQLLAAGMQHVHFEKYGN